MNKLLNTLVCNITPRFHVIAPAIRTAPLELPLGMSGGISRVLQGVYDGTNTIFAKARAGIDARRVSEARSLHD